jgi:hypothetical protein
MATATRQDRPAARAATLYLSFYLTSLKCDGDNSPELSPANAFASLSRSRFSVDPATHETQSVPAVPTCTGVSSIVKNENRGEESGWSHSPVALRGDSNADLSRGRARSTAALPGSRIVNSRGIPGTLGCVARARHNGRTVLLTTWHVLFGHDIPVSSTVWLASDTDRWSRLGTSLYGKLGDMQFEGQRYYLDCAVASIDEIPGHIAPDIVTCNFSGYGWAEPNTMVRKTGSASGTTWGIVADVSFAESVTFAGKKSMAERQLLIESHNPNEPFAVEGDSGAVVVDERNRAVGLLWGTRVDGDALAAPIAPVLFAMNLAVGDIA